VTGVSVRSPLGENHSPGHCRRFSEQFAINKIAYPSKSYTDRASGDEEVCGHEKVKLLFPCNDIASNEGPDKSSMKGHASVPNGKCIKWVLKIKGKVIEQYIPKARSYDKSDDEIEEKIINARPVKFHAFMFYLIHDKKVRRNEAEDIHKPIPSHCKRAYLKDHRIDMRKLKHNKFSLSV
jgi:hypothetical protein